MTRTRHQQGYVYKKGNNWMLRYYDNQQLPDGTITRVQKTRKLVEAVGEYRAKAAARKLAEEQLKPVNDSRTVPQSVMSLERLVEGHYLPSIEQQKRASTFHSYRNIWKRYLKPRAAIAVRDFTTLDGERILQEIAGTYDLSTRTMQHIKAFMSGIFRYAKRQGLIRDQNPMRDTVLPVARAAADTHAYSTEEITRMLKVLPELAATVVAAAAFTGARKGELRGFRWEDYDGKQLRICQAYWRGHLQEPKTRKSRAPVPVIRQLAERLDAHQKACGKPSSGLMFKSVTGNPIDLDALAVDVIRPAFKKIALEWHGWHAFRRGLATNLHRLGVSDETIQRVLRHSNISVTQSCYIKTADADAVAAMTRLENAPSMHLENAPIMHLEGPKQRWLM
jgi:integrase